MVKRRIGKFAGLSGAFVLLLTSAAGPVFSGEPTSFPAASASGQGRALILPEDGFAQGWKRSELARKFRGQDLFNHIDGGAEIFLEFGFVQLVVQSYTEGRAELVLEVYEMTEPAAALGIYLVNAGQETPWPEVPARNSSETEQITAIKGRFFLHVNNFEGGPSLKPAMAALSRAVLAVVPDEAPAPDPLRHLPLEGRVVGSERLIRGPVALQPFFTFGEGDILKLEGKVFGAIASFKDPDGAPFFRLVVAYPSTTEAAAALDHLKADLDPYLTMLEAKARGFSFRDFQKKIGIVELEGNVLSIRFGISRLL